MATTTEQAAAINATETYLLGLNDRQKTAVINTEGPSIVIAGAGSGKTRVLTARIAHVLKEKKAYPSQILALTFTNKAAAEMRHRIEAVVGCKAKEIWLGTFHSVFVKLLRHEASSLGYAAHFTIYDSDDSKSLIKQITKELGLDDKVYKPGVILSRISHAKNRLITPQIYATDQTYQAEDARMRMPRFSEIFLSYANHCLQASAMDFDDLLLQTHALLYTNPELSTKYQQKFRYLFIDEFQDTNLVQYRIIQKLAEHHHNICVVGDDAQSIYAFRGADIQNILHFAHDYPNHQIVKLEQNYRSTGHIVEVANHIISHNQSQLKKKVWTTNTLGEPVEVLKAMSDIEESRLVVDALIQQKLNHHLRYRDFAILYRTNNQSRNFEETLRKKNIPYRIIGGLSFYQRKEVKDLLAYLRFVVNHNDTEAFKRIINFPKRGIGLMTIDKILSTLEEKKLPLWTLLSDPDTFLSGSAAAAVSNFIALIRAASLKLTIEEENAYTIANYIATKSGLLKELYEDKTVEGLTRYAHIQELLNSLKQFVDNPENNDPSLVSFLQEIALITSGDQDNPEEDTLTLMTIHASKGLEFKCVYLVGMEEELFPSSMMVGNTSDLEEERRLFYVAATRAQLKLTLSYALNRYRFGKSTSVQPSRFLREISAYWVDNKRIQSKFTSKTTLLATTANKTPHSAASAKTPTRLYTSLPSKDASHVDLTTLQVGNGVRHAHFGEGKIIQLIESAGVRKAVILFHNFGEKTLLLQYAKLELLPTMPI